MINHYRHGSRTRKTPGKAPSIQYKTFELDCTEFKQKALERFCEDLCLSIDAAAAYSVIEQGTKVEVPFGKSAKIEIYRGNKSNVLIAARFNSGSEVDNAIHIAINDAFRSRY